MRNNMAGLKTAVHDLGIFESETAVTYPWAMAPETLVSDPVLEKIAAQVSPLPDGTYDTDALYVAIDQAAGVNPALKH